MNRKEHTPRSSLLSRSGKGWGWAFLFFSLALTSCGLIDIELDELSEVAGEMHLGRDTVYVMEGDSFVFTPVFDPDTIANQQVYYYSSADSVAKMAGDTVVAQSEGWAMIQAVSVSSRLLDSCRVCVLPMWGEVSPYLYPNETIVYAQVTIRGAAPTSDIRLGAFIGNELRGVGIPLDVRDHHLTAFRIWSDIDPLTEEDIVQAVQFRFYDRRRAIIGTFPQSILFDGDTHGTLNEPFLLQY